MSWAMARHVTRRLMPHLLDPRAEGVAAVRPWAPEAEE
jgi:hypothetical protein